MLKHVLPLMFLALGCADRGVDPPAPPKNPRTYNWTVDTLAYPDAGQTNMYDFSGTATSNVFVVGFNSSVSAGTMYRFDGVQWRTTGFHSREGGPISGSIDIWSLATFSASDTWFVGWRTFLNPSPPPTFLDSSFILHFDGNTWQEHKVYDARGLLSIDGLSPNNLWACGFHGTLLHYNGVSWKRDSIPMSVPEGGEYILRDIVVLPDQTVYLIGHISKPGALSTFYFFRRSAGTWAVVDSALDGTERWGTTDLWVSPSGTLYSVGRGVFRWDGASWTKMFEHTRTFLRIWGYDNTSFFVVGGGGGAFHHDGADFFQFSDLINENVLNFGVWGDGKELFIVGNDGAKSYVYRGR